MGALGSGFTAFHEGINRPEYHIILASERSGVQWRLNICSRNQIVHSRFLLVEIGP